MESVKRAHRADTGDSEAVPCPNCNGTKTDPHYGVSCTLCVGTGFLLQQRFDSFGRPVRVIVTDAADSNPSVRAK